MGAWQKEKRMRYLHVVTLSKAVGNDKQSCPEKMAGRQL